MEPAENRVLFQLKFGKLIAFDQVQVRKQANNASFSVIVAHELENEEEKKMQENESGF